MKKLLPLFAILISAVAELSAQQVKPAYESKYINSTYETFYGLKDITTDKWVVNPVYKRADYMGSYEGVHYYALLNMDNLWGFITSKDFSKMKVDHIYADYDCGTFRSIQAPIVVAKKGNMWGVIELYTKKCDTLYGFKYSTYMVGSQLGLKDLNGSFTWYSNDKIITKFNTAVTYAKKEKEKEDSIKIANENAARLVELEAQRRKAEEERLKKLAERLASFTNYAKEYVTPRINDWQKKGEFEKIAAYEARVTGENRLNKIAELTNEAEQLYIKDYTELNPIGVMELGTYDAENEVFAIYSDIFGKLLLPVPIDEGQDFKNNFTSVIKSKPEYFVQDDKLALKSLVFTNPNNKKSYKYSNDASLNYTQYEINANDFEFDPIQIPTTTGSRATATTSAAPTTTTTAALPTTAAIVKPVCRILSPKNNGTYSTESVVIKYHVTVGEGLSYNLIVSVNGEDVKPEFLQGTSKGVKVAEGKEMRLTLPTKAGEPCNILMHVVDSNGTYGEPQKVRLFYVGDAPKPKLHIYSVGVSNYQSGDLEPLNYAAKDAQDFINTVTNGNNDMYSGVSTTILVNEKATRNEVLRSLRNLVTNVGQDDVVMMFFSGHGIKDGEETFYMTYDSSAQDCFTGVNFSDIRTQIKKLTEEKKCHVLLFIDSCHAGSMYGMKGSTMAFSMKVPGLIGFYSSTSGQRSAELDQLKNGAFTHAIIQAFKGGAKNKDGEITIQELEAFVRTKVKEYTNNRQEPIIENMMGDAVIFKVK